MTAHVVILPVLLPLATGVALLLLGRLGIARVRVLSLLATAALVAIAVELVGRSAGGGFEVYALGAWPPPFGIVLVLDRLSALMVLLTAALALGCLVYAAQGSDGAHLRFHVLFQLQLMGLNGAFLTGDLFNLFVFFEVLLIASYGLLLERANEARLRFGFHYVVYNLAASALFLVAVAVLYGTVGTLNMAHLARVIGSAGPDQAGLIRAAGLLLFVVFAAKAALLPLYFWLPGAYGAAPAPVAALFTVMTKVGVYAIARVYTLVFGAGAGVAAHLVDPWLFAFALATAVVGTVGALAATELRRLAAYLLIASVGTMLAGIGLFGESAIGAGIYYMVHSTVSAAALFLLADLIARERGFHGDRLSPGPPLAGPAFYGVLFFLVAVSIAGVPPLSGFIGKLLLLQAAPPNASGYALWGVVLGTAILSVVALARAGSMLFWRGQGEPAADRAPAARVELVPVVALIGASALLTGFAQPALEYAQALAGQLLSPGGYVAAVLGAPAGVAP
ncbi:cation:proton antiporter [Sulfurifustis variabilis]|uniref:Cation:proton antiporter n=1 Tax=Sulfurifustis variabilis TaxID=1675686 RepID=A0A1B4V645_9GAMM|nr:monovalent cation/H+ antiporter subunit D [Sulfurifustis variabilis]BAU49019.1 cation:proton antiporter [Sulfurifustis variabilis]